MAVTGLIDDIMELGAKSKLVGQIAGACVIWFLTTSHFDNFKIPFGEPTLSLSRLAVFHRNYLLDFGDY